MASRYWCSILNIVKLKRIVKIRWKLARAGEKKLPLDVPPGHLAVEVGGAGKRFVVKADYLNHPIFKQMLDQAYEEYGYSRNGPLTIPCDEFFFQDIIHLLGGRKKVSSTPCRVAEEKLGSKLWKDSTPLLKDIARRSTC
ncbi:hypothetical protein K2173_001998 [Erythroxylum novogranatense]|uniref:Small auxin up regulated protein n=1 Tax=Erythroxylum novogranatense TaxID=1862640 RepID=A0AAV8SPY4_9ROSI|nr:hypothetical protein K2173_001998 [Erythroxylum novogranatense]